MSDDKTWPIRGFKVHLSLIESAVPVFHKAREPLLPLQKEVDKELDQMVENGIISPANEGSE